ncbi:MAG: hypothetical protein LBT46_13720 [Planctomycetaceae bacterium]|nr:hypothetical protein [Planctomycetaceae bacterium]
MIVLEDSEADCEAADRAGAFGVIILAQHNAHGNFAAAKLIAGAARSNVG